MSFPSPMHPDVNFPQRAGVKIHICNMEKEKEDEEPIPTPTMMRLVLAALRTLKNQKGSSLADIKRILCSGGYLTPSIDIRPAVILGIKQGKIKRPLSAVRSGTYGLYVEANVKGKTSRSRPRGIVKAKSKKTKKS